MMSAGQCHFCKPARTQIYKMQSAGMSDGDIIESFVMQYGEKIFRHDPNSYFWLVPYISLGRRRDCDSVHPARVYEPSPDEARRGRRSAGGRRPRTRPLSRRRSKKILETGLNENREYTARHAFFEARRAL